MDRRPLGLDPNGPKDKVFRVFAPKVEYADEQRSSTRVAVGSRPPSRHRPTDPTTAGRPSHSAIACHACCRSCRSWERRTGLE